MVKSVAVFSMLMLLALAVSAVLGRVAAWLIRTIEEYYEEP